MTLPGFDYPDQSVWCWAPGVWEDLEHDDLMDADDYDRRRAARDGWQTAHWDGR